MADLADLKTRILDLSQAVDSDRSHYDQVADLWGEQLNDDWPEERKAKVRELLDHHTWLRGCRATEIREIAAGCPEAVGEVLYCAARRLINCDKAVPSMLDKAAAMIDRPPSESPPEWFMAGQQAATVPEIVDLKGVGELIGRDAQTIRNKLSGDLPTPVSPRRGRVGATYRYSELRPVLLKHWPNLAHLLP